MENDDEPYCRRGDNEQNDCQLPPRLQIIGEERQKASTENSPSSATATSTSSLFLSLHVGTLMLILEYADAADVVNVSACAKRTKFISCNATLWNNLLQRDFPQFQVLYHRSRPVVHNSNPQSHLPAIIPGAKFRYMDENALTLESILAVGAVRDGGNGIESEHNLRLAEMMCPHTQYRYLHQAFTSPGCSGIEWSPTLPEVNDVLQHRESHDQSVIPGNRVYVRMGLCRDPDAYIFHIPPRGEKKPDAATAPDKGQNQEHLHTYDENENYFSGVTLQQRLKPTSTLIPNVYGHRISTICTAAVAHSAGMTSSDTMSSSDDHDDDTDDDDDSLDSDEQQQQQPQKTPVEFLMLQYGGCGDINYGRVLPLLTITTLDFEAGTLTDKPFRGPMGARAYHAQVVVGHRLYVFGGIVPGGRIDASMYCLDLDAAMPAFRDASLDRGEVIITDQRVMQASTRLQSSWMRPVYGHSMVAVGKKLYVAGGFAGKTQYRAEDTANDLTSIAEYDTVTGLWGQVMNSASVPLPRFLGRCHTASVYGPLIIYFGGTIDLSSTVVVFDTRTEEIIVPRVSLSGPSMPLPRHSHAASLVGTTLFITGGYNADVLSDARCCNLAAGLTVAAATPTVSMKRQLKRKQQTPHQHHHHQNETTYELSSRSENVSTKGGAQQMLLSSVPPDISNKHYQSQNSYNGVMLAENGEGFNGGSGMVRPLIRGHVGEIQKKMRAIRDRQQRNIPIIKSHGGSSFESLSSSINSNSSNISSSIYQHHHHHQHQQDFEAVVDIELSDAALPLRREHYQKFLSFASNDDASRHSSAPISLS